MSILFFRSHVQGSWRTSGLGSRESACESGTCLLRVMPPAPGQQPASSSMTLMQASVALQIRVGAVTLVPGIRTCHQVSYWASVEAAIVSSLSPMLISHPLHAAYSQVTL